MNQGKLRTSAKQIIDRIHTNVFRSLLIILAGTVAALACGWSLITDHSVRFNDHRMGRAFYRLPPLPIMYDRASGKEITVGEYQDSELSAELEEPAQGPTLKERADESWGLALSDVEKGNLSEIDAHLKKFLGESEPPLDLSGTEQEELQSKRNAARDMIDALSAIRQGSRSESVLKYLRARLNIAEPDNEQSEHAHLDTNLRDNWDYLAAAKLYIADEKVAALEAFVLHAKKYPSSEKNEAVLYMSAKVRMEASFSFENTSCGIEGDNDFGQPIDPSTVEPPEKCRDENWQAAVDAFKLLIRRYPTGAYVDDSRGWLAYLYRRGGGRAEALAQYYRMLGHPTSWAARIEAKKSLQMIGHKYGDDTLDRLEELIGDDVDAAMAYSYHRIYNHAIDYTYEEPNQWIYGDEDYSSQYEEDQKIKEVHETGDRELARVARFATKMMKQHPAARVSGGFVLRVAEAHLELKKFDDALKLADKALNLGVAGDLRSQALWVKGSAEHQRKDFRAATSTLAKLVHEFPKSKLTEGARRLLAITYEDKGDLESALDQYFELDYKIDAAYFVDVLMPTERLAKYVAGRPTIPQHNVLMYSLAVRYLRDNKLTEARSTLEKVDTKFAFRKDDFDPTNKPRSPKHPYWRETSEPFIDTSWVMQDLKTIETLRHLAESVEVAKGDEDRAEAMYQLGSYYFESSSLLFYNPAMWDGMRYQELSELDYANRYRLRQEASTVFDHFQSHDTLARAISMYMDLVNRYPNSRAAKDALYSAAVAHERLSDLNPYWRSIYGQGLFAGPRKVTYQDVRSAYPKYQLPKATYGWEPGTRTVNGGTGWAPPPKPLPRETKEHRIKRLLREGATTVSDYANKVLPKIETKVDGGINWYASAIEAAVYGIASGIGLWAIVLVGIGLHARRHSPESIAKVDEPANTDSRVDKFLK